MGVWTLVTCACCVIAAFCLEQSGIVAMTIFSFIVSDSHAWYLLLMAHLH